MKKGIVLIALAVVLAAVPGCKSTLAEGIALAKARSQVYELKLSDCFSEADGYHYPGISWGANFEAVQNATNQAINAVYGYDASGMVVYKAAYLKTLLLGRKNNEATVSFTEDGRCYMVSVMFSNEEKGAKDISQSELFEQYLEKLKEAFGEPTETENGKIGEEEGQAADATSYIWKYTTPDGKMTEIQWGQAFLSYAEEPDYVTLGMVWKPYGELESEDAAE